MVGHFVKLKLRLVLNGFKRSGQQRVGLVLGAFASVWAALAGFTVLLIPRFQPSLGRVIVIPAFVLLAVVWTIGPLLGYGVDETLNPSRLALLPLSRRQLMSGLFAASCIGFGAAITAACLMGAVIGFVPLGPGIVIVLAAVVVEFVMCIALARAVTIQLSRVLSSRKGRDVGAVALALLVGSSGLAFQALRFIVPAVGLEGLRAIMTWVRWLPPGWAADALVRARDGDLAVAALEVLGAAAVSGALMWLWGSGLERALTVAASSGGSSSVGGGLFSGPSRWLPRTRFGAVVAKELRYWWREPRRRVAVIMLAVTSLILIGLPGFFLVRSGGPELVLAPALLTWLYGMQSFNLFGMDGAALWMNAVAGDDARADLAGKNLALGVLVGVPIAVLTLAAAAVTDGWAYVPVGLAVSAGALGVAFAVGNVVSVQFPMPVPTGTNLWSQQYPGQGCTTALMQMVAMAVMSGLFVPLLIPILIGVFAWGPALALSVPLSLAYGFVAWRIGVNLAARRFEAHSPEVLRAVTPDAA